MNSKNIIRRTTEFALHIVRGYVEPGDIIIDATCGNGYDTLALAQMGPAAIYAFDVQEEAINETVKLLGEHGFSEKIADGEIVIARLNHENMLDHFGDDREFAKAILFNLGYLPGGDRSITTTADSTLAAVRAAMQLIAEDGLICITMYSGHESGKIEKKALLDFAADLDSSEWHASYISMINQKNDPPEILLITKKKRQ